MTYKRGDAVEVRRNGGWVPAIYSLRNEIAHWVRVDGGVPVPYQDNGVRPVSPPSPPSPPSYVFGQEVEVQSDRDWVNARFICRNEIGFIVLIGDRTFYREDIAVRPVPSSPPAEPAWFSVVTVLGGEYPTESQAISQAKRCAEANVGRAYYVVVLPKEHAIAEPAKAEWKDIPSPASGATARGEG